MAEIKKGYTTGTCAQAATKGACLMLRGQEKVEAVRIKTPSGVNLNLGLIGQEINKNYARCAVIKDSGDDPDVTNGAKIYAEARWSDGQGITIKGGRGVGIATKPGLAIPVGEWAINPVPRRMILQEALKIFPARKDGLELIISVANGKELAKKTFNPQLGIAGGISIIGTTGIVEPKSLDAYKASLALQLNVLKAQGHNKAIFILGYVGEKFYASLRAKRSNLFNGIASPPAIGAAPRNDRLFNTPVIKIGDHIGFMLKECAKKKISEAVLIGHIGKLVKVANGQFDTNIKFGDNRIKTLLRYARKAGAEKEIIEKISKQISADAAAGILKENHLGKVFSVIAKGAVKKLNVLTKHNLKISCIILSLKGKALGCHPQNCI